MAVIRKEKKYLVAPGVYVEWSLVDGNFAMTGTINLRISRGIESFGQNLEDILELYPNDEKLQRMVAVWREWHLNDMTAGSPAQEAALKLNKDSYPGYPISYYDWACSVLHNRGLQPDPNYMYKDKPYSYGSAWLRRELPKEIIAEIESWG